MNRLTDAGKKFKNKHTKEYEKMCKVMNLSKGKLDNEFALLLSFNDNLTAEDIVKTLSNNAGEVEDNYNKFMSDTYPYIRNITDRKVIWTNDKYDSDKEGRKKRRVREREYNRENTAREYKFTDTYVYRAMVASGLFNEQEYDGYRDTFRTDRGYGYGTLSNDRRIETLALFYKAGGDLKKLIVENENLNKLWMERAHIQKQTYRYGSTPSTITDEEWRKLQTEVVIMDFDAIAHSKEYALKEVEKYSERNGGMNSRYNCMPTFSDTYIDRVNNAYSDNNVELIKDVMRVMEYLGIGIVWNSELDNNRYGNDSRYKLTALFRKITTLTRKFIIDVKKGYEPADVREMMVEDMNTWIKAQARDHWRVFVRDDAPTEYADIQTKKKKAKSTVKVELCGKVSEKTEFDKLLEQHKEQQGE